MKYLATIKNAYDRTTMMFDTSSAAEQWLDENNNNLEHLTYIEVFNDDWDKIDSYVYTEEKK